jgi:murein DD-endopeptidase MepM/ murein hydrolase activator NlpD
MSKITDREMLVSIQSQLNGHLEATLPPAVPEVPVFTIIPPEPEPELLLAMPPEKNGSPPKGTNWDGWMWPVPFWNGEGPRISDGFSRHQTEDHRQHLGADIMFRNPEKMPRNIPENTPWYHMPSDTVPMLAMGPGHIWFAGKTSTGWTVKIDHHASVGFPLVTYYTHMSELFVPDWPEGGGGMEVFAGQQLGFIGNSPAGPSDPNHCHAELWDYSSDVGKARVDRALDPGKYLPYFSQLILPQAKVGLEE